VTRLTSTRNERVKAVAALARRRERRSTGRHLVEGPHAVGEALAAGVVETVFVASPQDVPPGHLEVPGGLEIPAGVEVVAVADHVLAHLADTTTPQGIVGVARDVTLPLEAFPVDGLMVVLDRLADPGNVGGIVRTADAAGAAGVVCLAGTADVLGPKAVRAAAGSTYHLPVAAEVEIDALVRLVRAHGRRLVGLQARAPRSVLDLTGDDRPLALVLGSEAHGLDPLLAEHLDEHVSVPMRGAAESLNVAVAAGIAIYAAAVGMGPAGDGSG
jgi:RNA methyltransferase, TrmH family